MGELIKIEDHKKIVAKGSMRFNYMFPVPKKCLVPVDFKDGKFSEKDKVMLQKEYKACKKMLAQAQKRVQRSLGALETRNLDLLDQTQHSLTYLTHESC